MIFLQFGKLCQQLVKDHHLPEINIGEIRGNWATCFVTDRSVMFALVSSTRRTAPSGGESISICRWRRPKVFRRPFLPLHFDRRGNMLESASDAFGNRRIIDEHDVPVILRRFLVTYLKE
jgi:hypothetical protein